MGSTVSFIVLFLLWTVVQVWLLPRLGVPT